MKLTKKTTIARGVAADTGSSVPGAIDRRTFLRRSGIAPGWAITGIRHGGTPVFESAQSTAEEPAVRVGSVGPSVRRH